jgi:hypothetical protein
MNSTLRFVLLGASVAALAFSTTGCQHSPPAGSNPVVVEPEDTTAGLADNTDAAADSPEPTDENDENDDNDDNDDNDENGENADNDENGENADNDEGTPEPAASLVFDDVVVQSIAEVEPPEVQLTNQCVDQDDARRFNNDATRYHAYLAEVAAAEKGWRRLADVVTLGPNSPPRRGSGFSNVDFTSDRIVDDQGDQWLKVGSWSCAVPSPPTTDYFIDDDLKVFRLRPDTSSCPIRNLDGCGTFARYGCGRKSPPNFHFARVPNEAMRVEDRMISISPARCVVIEPVGGYGPPPP